MLWFFRKRDAWLHYEVRRDPASDAFELVVTHAGGEQQLESFPDVRSVADRASALNGQLLADGWEPPAPARQRRTASPAERSSLGR